MRARIDTSSRVDWDDLRFFLAVARHGTLSGAARALEVTQPTVGRRVDAFEQRLGARLFVRRPQGYALTAAGRSMLAHVERMEHAATSAERAVAGRDAGLEGAVRVTASEWLVVRAVGPALAPLLAQHPGLAVELVADARHFNLVRRDADLALRPSRFEQQAVFQRKVARLGFGLYASAAYLARHGAPDFDAQCAGHAVIAMADDTGDVARAWLATACARARVAARTNGREPMAALAAAGVGLACLPRVVGDATAALRLVRAPPLPAPALWLGVHRDAREIPRVRAVIVALTAELARMQPALG